nr:unnamed protein product [Haemonchus contortus]
MEYGKRTLSGASSFKDSALANPETKYPFSEMTSATIPQSLTGRSKTKEVLEQSPHCLLYRQHTANPLRFIMGDTVADALEQLTAEQIEQFRKYFNMFDKENKGYIRATQVGQILRTMGQAFEERDLKQLIKEFDTDGSGEIEFEEFAAMVANFVVNSEDNEGLEEELREAFRLYDKQGNGYINVSDLRDILRALDENVSEEELDEMIAEIDTDGSGTVDFDEFMEMMSGE